MNCKEERPVKLRKSVALTALIALLIVPGIASAHILVGMANGGLAAGFAHPFSGVDHMLAMLTVGLWAATLGGSASWKVPAAFVTMLVTGALLGMSGGVHLPLVEPFIAVSVLVLGLAVTLTWRVSTGAGMFLVGLFALFHGYAHGTALPDAAGGFLFLLGMTTASIVLHFTGFALGSALKRHQWLLRSGGALIAGAGIWLVATL